MASGVPGFDPSDAPGSTPRQVAEQPRKEDRIRTAARAMLDGVVG